MVNIVCSWAGGCRNSDVGSFCRTAACMFALMWKQNVQIGKSIELSLSNTFFLQRRIQRNINTKAYLLWCPALVWSLLVTPRNNISDRWFLISQAIIYSQFSNIVYVFVGLCVCRVVCVCNLTVVAWQKNVLEHLVVLEEEQDILKWSHITDGLFLKRH